MKIYLKRFWTLTAFVAIMLSAVGCAILTDGVYDSQNPKQSPSGLYNQALEQYQGRKYAEAKPLFQQYIGQYQDTPLYRVALYYLGHCDQMLGETKEAQMFYSRLIDTFGDDDFWGAQAMQRLKQIKETK